MSRISRQRGKAAELSIARYWRGKRNHFEAEDVQHPLLSIECKARSRVSAMVVRWYSQARAACSDGKIACVQVHQLGGDYGNDLVIIRASDLRDLLGGGE